MIFPCGLPSFDVYDIFISQVIFLYFTPPPNTHTKTLVENPFCQKKISGVSGHVFGTEGWVSWLFHKNCIEKKLAVVSHGIVHEGRNNEVVQGLH